MKPPPIGSESTQTRASSSQPSLSSQLAGKIFISYRHLDSADVCGRIYDRLERRFGQDAVFKDVDSIPPGANFKKLYSEAVGQCKACLVVIGDQYVSIADKYGQRRLLDPKDHVRIEVEAALQRNVPVIPVLVRGADMPSLDDLPESMQELSYRKSIPVRRDPDFNNDMDKLIRFLEGIMAA